MIYEVVVEYSVRGLNAKVNEKLAQGWELQGGVTMATDVSGLYYAQAMIWVD